MTTYLALDFETANHARDSACALGIAVVAGGDIVEETSFLVRPPSHEFLFTCIHGLEWRHVQDAPTFGELWPRLNPYLEEADFLVAHNAPFDMGVLAGCCETYRLAPVRRPSVCTVRVAREVWGIYPTKLPDVCRHLGIGLKHHDAASDASACAGILVRALGAGWRVPGSGG
ncbi:MAG: 3'-5' exonuclease [Gammaproteobacteria bacterium]